MKSVKGEFIPDIDYHQNAAGNGQCQTENIDKRKKSEFQEISEYNVYIIFKHGP
jgi:hypothetical protein